VRAHRELVTVVGYAAAICAGEWITAAGEWVNGRTHGQRFKTRFMCTSAPTCIGGIEKYLSSGMIRGIGPVYAKRMVKALGEKVFGSIEVEPDRLREVDGIGPEQRDDQGDESRLSPRNPHHRGQLLPDRPPAGRRSSASCISTGSPRRRRARSTSPAKAW
jgi:hypothetical protein